MVYLKLRFHHGQSIFLLFYFILIITIVLINILPLPGFFRVAIIFFPLITIILSFELYLSTWSKAWIISVTLLVVASQVYPSLSSYPLLLFHILFLLGMMFLYANKENQDRQLHQRHIQTMRVLLRQNPPLIQTVDYTHEAMIVLDNTGCIVESNPQATFLLSLSASSLVGQPISDVLGILVDFRLDNVPKNGNFTWKTQKEGEKHLRFVTRPLLDYGIPSGILLILFDISEEKNQLEAYLQSAKLSVISQVSAGLADEIRNPLTTVKGFMQLITPEQWPESFRPYQQLILDEVQTIDKMLNSFVLLTSPSAPQLRQLNLVETIHATAQMIHSIHLMQSVNLVLELSSHSEYVMGDEEQLLQALLSILNNAIQASPKGGQVIIRLTEHESLLRISVIDNGPGIPENLRHRILDPFFTTQKESTGLGLTIAQQIILAHHGKLHFSESVTPCGTEVMIDLPRLTDSKSEFSA